MSAAEKDPMEVFLEQRRLLPTRCPSWCSGPDMHVQALEEEATLEQASEHYGPEYTLMAGPMPYSLGKGWYRELTGVIHAQLRRETLPVVADQAFIHLTAEEETRPGLKRVSVPLTSGEARVLAKQLVHLADLVDLEE